ncbi:unnamed protein product [Mytilus coruscus]|uniref:Uncharacterized protein n=1 Tax=Mytilus coruscus TaxID=42192 RepID=A0A6J8CX31_MYTCO|nr:unnamed protein product [Mytilus coruscus]
MSAMSSMVVGLLANKMLQQAAVIARQIKSQTSTLPQPIKLRRQTRRHFKREYICGRFTEIGLHVAFLAQANFRRFYRYHKLFSAKVPNAIIEHNIAINWGKVDDRLLHLGMNVLQSRECELCGDYDHTTTFYRKQVYQETPLCAQQNTTNTRVVDKTKGRYGRGIVQVEGHDLCNNFYYGTCK